MLRRFLALCCGVLALLLTAPAARAVQPQKGTIEISLRYKDQPLSGGTLTAIRVGSMEETADGIRFRRIPDGKLLEDVSSPSAVRELEDHVKQAKFSFEKRTVSVRNGSAIFCSLPTGLYLIRQDKAAEGFYPVNAFLVSLPYFESGEALYHIIARSKTELKPKPTPILPEKLPQTGQLTWPVPTLSAVGMSLLSLGWFLKRRKM